MTKRGSAKIVEPFFKVRVALDACGLLYLASRDEPRIMFDDDGRVAGVDADWLEGVGDTIGHIDWSSVVAVTWRSTERTTS